MSETCQASSETNERAFDNSRDPDMPVWLLLGASDTLSLMVAFKRSVGA